ncbi:MAG: type I-C CRISPR-associated protein Cas5c [Planctomycetes bacterium]|nr:type I-C CRISPR-associated protein Cas5c [Planctomycetota bacterium]
MAATVSVKVWGEHALFTRPDLSVERLTYPLMTPSAARGVLDAILFKPQMMWHVRRITVLKPQFPPGFPEFTRQEPFRFIQVRRNEIQGTIAPRTVEGWMKEPKTFEPYLVDSAGREGVQGQNRTQRNSLILHHVAYRIDATPKLTAKANKPRSRPEDDEDRGPDTVAKYVAMFNRRVEKGQCFHRPYLGCREFACQFAPSSDADEPLVSWNLDLGLMLYDIRFGADGQNRPGFFAAKVINGVLHCDTEHAGPNGEPPVSVVGWDSEGGAA